LRKTELESVPERIGVYMVIRESDEPPTFLEKSLAGHFKGRDPTVPIEKLREQWVDRTVTLYIGKAGGPRQNTTIRKRLDTYFKFGEGQPVSHWGGRLIWQLEGSESLLICWLETPKENPRHVEKDLLAQFKKTHDERLPFANLQK